MVKAEGAVGDALQQALVDLIALELQCKQAHWNIKGDRFRSLHLALDEVVALVRTDLDEVAERLATLGGNPDGRAATVARTKSIDDIDGGDLPVDKTYLQMAEKIQVVCDKMRQALPDVDDADPVSGDLLIGIIGGLEQQAWFLRAATQ
ncbi:MAG: DNA starvation/stationary phase protection protein [Actinomycetaceae bacterium]|nr:DNA starvation/stationary phase protection protein [Actinomycetaceae bacterium]